MFVSLSSGHELSSQVAVMFTADRHHSLRASSFFPFLHSGDRSTVLHRLALDFADVLPQSQRARMADLHHPNTKPLYKASPWPTCVLTLLQALQVAASALLQIVCSLPVLACTVPVGDGNGGGLHPRDSSCL